MAKQALRFSSSLKSLVLSTTLSSLALSYSYAAPQDGTVAAGSAQITTNGASTLILQSTDKAAIDWRSFDVKTNESVVFQQPASSSMTLNRIHDQKPSEIFGSISSNGQIILSNPNGMIFGHDSRIDVAGLVATTASISTNSFMNDAVLFFTQSGNTNGKITNYGTITAKEAGLVALIAPNVENQGLIGARLGQIELAGADRFAVDFYGDGLLSIAVDFDTAATAVSNTGTLRARGGEVVLTAAQAAHVVSSTVNLNGIVDVAASRTDANGTVVFGDGIGGNVTITGKDIHLADNACIVASGPNGGGSVNVGGEFQGGGTLPWADTLRMDAGARIAANATGRGDGGQVVLWSKEATQFDGTINARGGKEGGNGGMIETSSKGGLGVTGYADASSPKGVAGNWLLDPRDVTISGAGAYSVNPGGETVNPGTDNFTILDSSISTALTNGNNVTVTTGNSGAQVGDITLSNATIAKTGGGDATLTLKADGSVLTSGTNAITSTSGKLHTVFWSDADSVNRGKISLVATTITTNGGDIVMAGKLDDGANGGVAGDGRPDGFAETNLDNGVNISSNSFLSAGGGNIMAIGYGPQRGVLTLGGAQITTSGAGNITFIGSSYGSGLLSYGVNINNDSYIAAGSGTITLTGSSTGAATNNYGTVIENGGTATTVETTGNGDINITSMKSAGCCADFALGGTVATSTVRSLGTGTITVNADSISMGSPLGIIQTNGSIVFRPRTASTTYGISGGTCGGSCNIPLTDAILARLFPDNDGNGVGSLIIGDAAAGTGLVEIAGWDISGNRYDVEVYGGTVNFDTGAIRWNQDNSLLFYSRTGIINIDTSFFRDAGLAGDGTLTIKASGIITTSGTRAITTATGAASGKLHTILWSDAEAAPNNDGYISLANMTITTNGGDVILGGGLDNGANGGAAADGRPDNYAWGNAGTDDGITLNNTDINAGGGDFRLLGHGRNNAASSDQAGIKINTGSLLQTSGSGGFTITGIAGGGTDDNRGVHIADAGTELNVVNGAIVITGTGAGSGQHNFGIEFHNGAEINSTGTGAGVGTITFDGTASATATGQENIGVMIRNPNTLITTVDGDISITGRGNNSAGIKGSGIWVHNDAHVETTGAGANAGDIALTGYGLNGDEQHGIIFQAHGKLYTARGNINVTGSAAGSGNAAGILFVNGGEVDSLNGNITLTGSKVGGTSDITFLPYTDTNLVGSNTMTGNITLEADTVDFQAADIRTQNDIAFKPRTNNTSIGVSGGGGTLQINDAALNSLTADVDANGTGSLIIGDNAAGTGTVDINGWDISNKRYDVEVYGGTVDFTGSSVIWNEDNSLLFNARVGSITIDQSFTRNAGTAGDGILTFKAVGNIFASGTTSISAATAGATGRLHTVLWSDYDNSSGGRIHLSGLSVTTNGGDFIAAGGLDDGADILASDGVTVLYNGIAADGRPDNDATGTSGANNDGILLDTTDVTAGTGNIILRGHGYDEAVGANDYKLGLAIFDDSDLTTTSGNIILNGMGGNGNSYGRGVGIYDATTRIATASGNISVMGRGATTGALGLQGIIFFDGATIESTGTGAGLGAIALDGVGGNGTGDAYGVYLNDIGSLITSIDGNIHLTGSGGNGTGTGNKGIYIYESRVTSTGNGVNAASINLTGTGSGTADSASGIEVYGNNARILTVDGDITITGQGAAAGTWRNSGIELRVGSVVESTGTGVGAGTITLNGTAGDGTAGTKYGVFMEFGADMVKSVDGGILITGNGGDGWDHNKGIYLSNASIASTGSADITLNGTGGHGASSSNHGIEFDNSDLSTVNGNIALTGTRGDINAATSDIRISGGAQTIGGAAATGAQTWTADTVSLANFTADTDGAITFRTRTLGQNISLGGAVGGLELSDANLDALVAGSLIFGQATGTGTITLDSYAWDDPVRFLTAATGSIAVSGAQTAVAASDAAMRFSGPTTLSNNINISAAGGARTLAFNHAVTLGADTTLNTGAGDITLDSTLNGTHDLGVVTTGDLTFTGNVGLLNALADVSISGINDFSADIFHAQNFTLTGGTGNVTFSNNSLHAAGDVDIATAGNITGTYYGINGSLYSTTGNVNATVYFDSLDIDGLGATLLAGRVGVAGPANQTMANRISINGVSYPALVANAAYTFAGYIIGNNATVPPGSGGSGGGAVPPAVPPVDGGGNGGIGGNGGNSGSGFGSGGIIGRNYNFEAAKRIQVLDATRGTLLFETAVFDPTFGSILVAPAPELGGSGMDEVVDPSEFEVISTKSGKDAAIGNGPLHKKPLYRVVGGFSQKHSETK